MSYAADADLLDILLDSWDRNHRILVNLLHAIPEGGMEARAVEGGPTVAQLFAHIHYVRLVFVEEDAKEFALPVPGEWDVVPDRDRMAALLDDSAAAVRSAVEHRIRDGRGTDVHFDHPILFLQHMIWHEGYHHGQIKLALKIAGRPLSNREAGPLTWRIWMNKTA